MKIKIEKKNDITVLQITGNLDADSVAQFKKAANAVIDEGRFQLMMDATALDFIDSMGLGCLISLLRKVRSNSGDLKIKGLNKEVRTIFEITRLHRLFEIV